MTEKLTDEELVALILNKESEYFGLLYERYREKVFAKCLGMVHDPILAEDHAQDIMIKAMKALATYSGKAKFSTWLYSISYNHCIDYLRKNKRVRFESWIDVLDIPIDTDEAEAENIMAIQKERLTLLLEILEPSDKAIMVLRYWEGMNLERIQYIMSIESMGAMKMRLVRARKRLRALYHKFHPSLNH